MIVSSSIHLPANFISLKISLCMCTIFSLSVHQLIDIKEISNFLVIMNKTATNMDEQISLWKDVSKKVLNMCV